MWKQWDANKIVGTQMKVWTSLCLGRIIQESSVEPQTRKIHPQSIITLEAIIFPFQAKKQILQMYLLFYVDV